MERRRLELRTLRKGFLEIFKKNYKIYQCMWHLLIVLPVYFSELARGKGEVILGAVSFSCFPESLGLWKHSFSFKFLFFIMKWKRKKYIFIDLSCFVMYFGSYFHVGFLYLRLYTLCICEGNIIRVYLEVYLESNTRNLPLLLMNVTYIKLLLKKKNKSVRVYCK